MTPAEFDNIRLGIALLMLLSYINLIGIIILFFKKGK